MVKDLKQLELENRALRRHLRRHRPRHELPPATMHVGLHAERLDHNPREMAFATTWAKECDPSPGYNHGYGLLQDLMFKGSSSSLLGDVCVCMERITQRDAEIVATVIQWLGSNIGMEFLSRCLAQCGYMMVKREI